MSVPAPHFLLHARAHRAGRSGRWCFMLQSNDGSHSMKIEDSEPQTSGDRLELLALVRGLEALPRPAQVTVVAASPYLNRMLNGGLEEWRANDWRWEHHGEMVPVKNADLWRRVDRALHFHEVRLGARSVPQSSSPQREGVLASSAATPQIGGARRAIETPAAAPLVARRQMRRRKSFPGKVVVMAAVLRRRFRQRCRAWSSAIQRLAVEDDMRAWAG